MTNLYTDEREGSSLHIGSDESDDGGGAGEFCLAGGRGHGGTKGPDRFYRAARHRADHKERNAEGLPDVGIPAGARYDRHDSLPRRAETPYSPDTQVSGSTLILHAFLGCVDVDITATETESDNDISGGGSSGGGGCFIRTVPLP